MGKEISYCESCGHRLVGDAVLHDGRRYCQACRPTSTIPVAPPPPAPATARPSSGRLPRVPARRTKESTRIRRKRGLLVPGISAAAAAALAVGIALATSGSPPEIDPVKRAPAPAPIASPPVSRPVPAPDPAPSPEELLARVREIRENDLMFDRRDEVVKLLRQSAGRGEADRVAADYDRQYEEAAARLADFARSEALRLAGKQKIAEAVASLDGYPASFRGSRAAATLESLRRDLERRRASPDRGPVRTPPGTSPILPLIAGRNRSL